MGVVNIAASTASAPTRRVQQQRKFKGSRRRAFFPRGRVVVCANTRTPLEGGASVPGSVLNRRLALMGAAGTLLGSLTSVVAIAAEEDAEVEAIRKAESDRLAKEALERYNRMRNGPKTSTDQLTPKPAPGAQARGAANQPTTRNFGDRAKTAPKKTKAEEAPVSTKPEPVAKKMEPVAKKLEPVVKKAEQVPKKLVESASKKPQPVPKSVRAPKPVQTARTPSAVEKPTPSMASSSTSDAEMGSAGFDLGSAGIGAGIGAITVLGGLALLLAGGGGSGVAQAVRGRGAVFVAGATGRTGRRLVRELLSRGIKVRAGVRSLDKGEEVFTVSDEDEDDEYGESSSFEGYLTPAEANRLTLVEFNLGPETSDDEVAEALQGASSVVCCLGAPESIGGLLQVKKIDGEATQKLIRAAQISSSVRQFVMVSSLGTGKSGWPASVLNLFGGILTVKRGSEVALEDSGLDYLIVRPGGMERPTDEYKETHNVILKAANTTFGGQVSRLQVAELISAAVTNPGVSRNKIVEVIAETTAEQRSYSELLASIPGVSGMGVAAGADKADADFRPAGGLARGRTVKGSASLSPGAQRKVSRLEQQTARDNGIVRQKAGGTMFASQALARGREAYASSLEEQTASDNPRPGLEGLKRGGTMFVSALNAGVNAALRDLKEEEAEEARKNAAPMKRGGTMFASQARKGGAEVVRSTPVKKRGGTMFVRGPMSAGGTGMARDPAAVQREAAERNREVMEALKGRMEAAKQARKAEVAEASRQRAAEYARMEELKAKELAKAQAEAERESERIVRDAARAQAQAQRESDRLEREAERKRAQSQAQKDSQSRKAREPVAVASSDKAREDEISDESVAGEGWMAKAMGWEEVPDPRDSR